MIIELLQRIERLERQMHNICLLGTIADANYQTARVKVAIGDLTTGWLPWLTHRAGDDITWHAPEIGEQVVVISPSGEIGNGVVIPAIYQDAHPANGNRANQHKTTYKDGTTISYDRTSHTLRIDCVGSVEIVAAETVHLGDAGGPAVARIGDHVNVGAGSSAGMWPIVEGASRVTAT